MSLHPTGRSDHDATAGTLITCAVVVLLTVLLVVWAVRGGPFSDTPPGPPTPIPVVIVTPEPPGAVPTGVPTGLPTLPAPLVTRVPTGVPTAVETALPPAVPTGVPTDVPTAVVMGAIALHDGTTPLLGVPCWSRARKPHPTCTPSPPPPLPTDTPTAAPTATQTPTVVVTPSVSATQCRPDPVWSCAGMERAFEEETARLINEHRAGMGLPPFEWVDSLHRAEVPWAQQMVANNECYHGDFGARAIAEGYNGWPWGEIGSCGYPNPRAALQGWLDSPGHRSIVEVPDMTQIGVGMAYYPNRYASTWAIVGRP